METVYPRTATKHQELQEDRTPCLALSGAPVEQAWTWNMVAIIANGQSHLETMLPTPPSRQARVAKYVWKHFDVNDHLEKFGGELTIVRLFVSAMIT